MCTGFISLNKTSRMITIWKMFLVKQENRKDKHRTEASYLYNSQRNWKCYREVEILQNSQTENEDAENHSST